MSTISAGLLKVTNLTANGASGALEATNATVTNLTATNVSANNLGFVNLDVSGNLNVKGATTLRDVNNLGTMDVSGNMNVRGVTTLKNVSISGILGATSGVTSTLVPDGGNTQLATTAYVQQHAQVLEKLHEKTFCIPLIFTLTESEQVQER